MIYDSLVHNLAKNQGKTVDFDAIKTELVKTAKIITHNVNLQLDPETLDALVYSENYFMVGLDNGAAEELTLKSYEITRKMALFYPDTHIVHGVEEAIDGNCAIIFQPSVFESYLSDFEKFSAKTNCQLVGMDVNKYWLGPEVGVKNTFSAYCMLASG